MQTIPIKIRRMNAFCISNICNKTDLFHSSTSVYRLVSRNYFHNRAQRALRAQHLLKQCPTPTSNRGKHGRSAGYYISNAPAESRSAGCGARRKAVRLSGRRHGVAPWASVKLPLRPAFRSRQAYPSKAQQAQPFPREYPSKARQAQECPEASRPRQRPRCRYPQRGCPWWSTSWAKVRQAPVYPWAFPSREAQAQACPEASRPSPRPKCRYPQRVCPWWSTSWSKAQPARAFLRAYPSRGSQARACPEASRPSPRPRCRYPQRGCPAYRRPWANRPVARWRRASFCRAARSSRRGPSRRGRDECATRGGTPRALA